MDWDFAIDKHRAALKRVLAALASMAGLAGPHPERSEDGQDPRLALKAEGEPRRTLPRHLHRAVLRLLRPAEAAARRLIIVAAKDIEIPPPPALRATSPASQGRISGRGRLQRGSSPVYGGGVAAGDGGGGVAQPYPTRIALPLLDPLRWDRRESLRASRTAMPRICVPGWSQPASIPPPQGPDDEIDATRLALRFSALARALDDLPREARRYARWRARSAAAADTMPRVTGRRLSPLRFGRPPGQRPPTSRRPAHAVHQILEDVHGLAFDVLKKPDTS
jgi:hypothetical protein